MPAIILLPAISFLTTHPVSPNAQCQSRLLNLAQLLCISSFHWEFSGLPSFSWRMRFYLVKIIQVILVCLSRSWITLISSTVLESQRSHGFLDMAFWIAEWRGGNRCPVMMSFSWLEFIHYMLLWLLSNALKIMNSHLTRACLFSCSHKAFCG